MPHPNQPTEAYVPEIAAKDLALACSKASAPVLIDVREGWEFSQGTIAGSLHLPLAQISEHTSSALGLAADTDIVTFCHHGVRSQKAAQALQKAGYTRVRSLKGGIDAWATEVDERVGRY